MILLRTSRRSLLGRRLTLKNPSTATMKTPTIKMRPQTVKNKRQSRRRKKHLSLNRVLT